MQSLYAGNLMNKYGTLLIELHACPEQYVMADVELDLILPQW